LRLREKYSLVLGVVLGGESREIYSQKKGKVLDMDEGSPKVWLTIRKIPPTSREVKRGSKEHGRGGFGQLHSFSRKKSAGNPFGHSN